MTSFIVKVCNFVVLFLDTHHFFYNVGMELLLNGLAITGAEDYKVIDFTLHMDFFLFVYFN